MPVYGTMAARFNDDGVTALYQAIASKLGEKGLKLAAGKLPPVATRASTSQVVIVPPARSRYLAEIADTVRQYHRWSTDQARIARERQQLRASKAMLAECKGDAGVLEPLIADRDAKLDPRARKLLDMWPKTKAAYAGDEYVVKIRDKEIRTALTSTSLSGTKIRKVALPAFEDDGEILRWQLRENVPGSFPYTAGVFAFKRENEDPTRMFAGEGDAFRTNKRFHLLADGMPAKRLSTAFDSVTLYGNDPDRRPDIYGKVGNSGVSIATLDDMKVLYSGFDLCDPATSVSMTINGPAPTILAMFVNTAIDQQLDKFAKDNGREPTDDEAEKIRAWTLTSMRGTVQADILKEDQGQNTCIFSTEFSLKVMGDIQEYFVRHAIRNFYSVSISGYHIAEAGANPISQLAFTLSNGFTFVEAYLARGNARRRLRAEPVVLLQLRDGSRVLGHRPRRAADLGGGDEEPLRRQRALAEAQVPLADVRPQPARAGDLVQRHPDDAAGADLDVRQHQLAAHQRLRRGDHHAHGGERAAGDGDPAHHQPRVGARQERESQPGKLHHRRADRPRRGGRAEGVRGDLGARRRAGRDGDRLPARQDPGRVDVLRAQEARRQLSDRRRQHVPGAARRDSAEDHRARPLDTEEKESQLTRLASFHRQHAGEADAALVRLKDVVIRNGNIFDELVRAVRVCSLGQITNALFEVGGQYRRSM
jgi:methylmalonyl-CoA mutase